MFSVIAISCVVAVTLVICAILFLNSSYQITALERSNPLKDNDALSSFVYAKSKPFNNSKVVKILGSMRAVNAALGKYELVVRSNSEGASFRRLIGEKQTKNVMILGEVFGATYINDTTDGELYSLVRANIGMSLSDSFLGLANGISTFHIVV